MTYLYWLIPAVSIFAQILFTINSQNQIRYEELAESVRNVFWLQHGLIYDGVSSNVGWYGVILIIYKLFGFSLFTTKYLRLFLHIISILCLTKVLKKYLGKNAWLPLLIIGLSPTLLYFNTLQASFGIDLQYFPIILFLLTFLDLKNWWGYPVVAGVGILSMIAWMSYPTFVFYLPVIFLLPFLPASQKRQRGERMPKVLEGQESSTSGSRVKRGMTSALGFLWPLILAFIYVQNKSKLIFDSTVGSGIFRGAGGAGLSLDSLPANLTGVTHDLFEKGASYHFDLFKGEFSDLYPILSVLLVVIVSLKFKLGRYLTLALILVIFLASLTVDPSNAPGIRRYTPALAVFYTLMALSWQYITHFQFKNNFWKYVCFGGMGLLLLHHLIVFPINLIHLKDPSPTAYPIWFTLKDNPQTSLDSLVNQVQKEDLKLVCKDELNRSIYCRLSEVYGALAGSCQWNHLACHQISGFDPNSNKIIPLSVDLWESGQLEH